MATLTVFDPTTQRSKSIVVDVISTVVQEDETGELVFRIKLSTTAKNVNGSAIPTLTLERLTDLVRTTTQHDGVTKTPYASMSAAIEDYILEMVEGTGGGTEMSFS